MFVTANIFQPLISVFEAVLKFFHNNVGAGWGLSIVLLTILVRLLLFPLALRQFHSMRRMQQHMPELKAIQTKYKEDKQRQQQEMMTFYRENKINPFASCLPLVAQIPVFISLFYMLRKDLRDNICPSVQHAYRALKHLSDSATVACTKGPQGSHAAGAAHAGFLFIHDLTNNATGVTLIVLILLYVGTQLGSSLVMMAMSPQQDKMQRNLMLFLPLVFVFIIIGFPAGLLVYWITTNAWTILQQFLIGRRVPPLPAVATSGGGGGTGGGGRGASGGGRGSGGPRGGNGGPPDSDGEGGLGGLLGRLKPATEPNEPAGVAPRGGRGGPPPPPPRKKKKRSGRRR